MGCANSKQTQCRHCKRPYSPPSRSHSYSYSLPTSYQRSRRSQRRSDSYHVITPAATYSQIDCESYQTPRCSASVASFRTSSYSLHSANNTLDSIKVNDYSVNGISPHCILGTKEKQIGGIIDEDFTEEVNAPITPTITPPGEPETINAWELMEGLEDYSPVYQQPPNVINRCFSFRIVPDDHLSSSTTPQNQNKKTAVIVLEEENDGSSAPKEKWVVKMKTGDQNSASNSNSIVSDFDPEIISTFRKALDQLSPRSAINLRSPENEKIASSITNRFLSKNDMKGTDASAPTKCNLNCEDKVVIYYTSLRGVRKTYEDCCSVRVILQGTGMKVDERDVSMHYRFREELKDILGSGFSNGLPKVFAKGRYIGGAYEIKQMNEEGELMKLLEGCEMEINGEGCEMCGDVKFVPCEKCCGSCKIYYEEGDEGEGGGFVRCPHCNENGLLRCPVCCG